MLNKSKYITFSLGSICLLLMPFVFHFCSLCQLLIFLYVCIRTFSNLVTRLSGDCPFPSSSSYILHIFLVIIRTYEKTFFMSAWIWSERCHRPGMCRRYFGIHAEFIIRNLKIVPLLISELAGLNWHQSLQVVLGIVRE